MRGRPKRLNTIEGKRHRGGMLFCTKKPPKTEADSNETTHHQRAHVKLNRLNVFGQDSTLKSYGIEISMDGKAYIRPGTDVGYRNTRASVILELSDEEKQNKRPQHDFPVAKVCQTPSSFRVMTWKTEIINGEEKLIKETDQSMVTIRPKYYIGSTGSVWAGDLLKLRYEGPKLFELKENSQCYSIPVRQCLSQINDCINYFKMTTADGDIHNMFKFGPHSQFYIYEQKRSKWASSILLRAKGRWDNDKNNLFANELSIVSHVLDSCNSFLDYISECTSIMSNNNIIENEDVYKDKISTHSENIIEKIKQLELPNVAPIISELTDAGPGVGVKNLEVKARLTEMCMIQDTDRRVRIYRARGDSGQNEAERTNASIADSLVDGGTMKWNYYEDYDGLTDEQVKEMSISELDMHIETNMEKNA